MAISPAQTLGLALEKRARGKRKEKMVELTEDSEGNRLVPEEIRSRSLLFARSRIHVGRCKNCERIKVGESAPSFSLLCWTFFFLLPSRLIERSRGTARAPSSSKKGEMIGGDAVPACHCRGAAVGNRAGN